MGQIVEAVSAGAIILREVEGKLKIALAQHQKSPDDWALPKGHVEPGETIEQTARREVYEETGLSNIQLIKYLGLVTRQSVRDTGVIQLKKIHYYLAYSPIGHSEELPTDAKFKGVAWFTPEEILALVPHKEDLTFLKEQLEPLFS
ncbi:NUDIX hydrolase [Ktedonosporobacter rubrisoli]|nr:NUDIX domain-containing protein [Ktedonosporobacter rubrisoli]